MHENMDKNIALIKKSISFTQNMNVIKQKNALKLKNILEINIHLYLKSTKSMHNQISQWQKCIKNARLAKACARGKLM